MHGIGRFIAVGNLFRRVENAGNTRHEVIPFEKPHATSFVLAQPDISMDLASHPACNDVRGLQCLWLGAGKKLCETEA